MTCPYCEKRAFTVHCGGLRCGWLVCATCGCTSDVKELKRRKAEAEREAS